MNGLDVSTPRHARATQARTTAQAHSAGRHLSPGTVERGVAGREVGPANPHPLPAAQAEPLDPSCQGWLFHAYRPSAHHACLAMGMCGGEAFAVLHRLYDIVYHVAPVPEQAHCRIELTQNCDAGNSQRMLAEPWALPIPDSGLDLAVLGDPSIWQCHRNSCTSLEREVSILAEVSRVLSAEGVLVLDAGADSVGRRLAPPIHGKRRARIADGGPRSHGDWREHLALAGFRHIETYWQWPSSRCARLSGTLDADSIRYVLSLVGPLSRRRFERVAFRWASRAPGILLQFLLDAAAPARLIVATRQCQSSSYGLPANGEIDSSEHFVRMTMACRPTRRIHTTFLVLNRQHGSAASGGVARAVRVEEETDPVMLRSKLVARTSPGINGRPFRPHQTADISLAARWLEEFHRQSARGVWSLSMLEREIGRLAAVAALWPEMRGVQPQIDRYVDRYLGVLSRHLPCIVGEHGDFTPPNLMVGPEGRLIVLDWEYRRDEGHPMVDAGAFCLSLLRRTAVSGRFKAGGPRSGYASFQRIYCSGGSLALELAPAYYILRWLERIANVPGDSRDAALRAARVWMQLLGPSLAFALDEATV